MTNQKVSMPEKRVIRLGYVETDYPYVTECGVSPNWTHCRAPGINMVIWRELAFRLNYEFVFVKSNFYGSLINDQWTGLMGALLNGTIDATLALLTVSQERWNASRFSLSVVQSDFGFARGQFQENNQYQFHVFVFSPIMFLCLFISILLVGCIVVYRVKNIHGFWDAFSLAVQKDKTARHFKNPLIILAFLAILLMYQAGANSERLSWKASSSATTFAAVRRELKTGRSRLVLATPSAMGETVIDLLLQRPHADICDLNPVLELDEQHRIKLLCENSNMITFGELRGLLSSKYIPRDCALQRVELPEKFDQVGMLAFGFSKNFSSAHLRHIDAIIGRIFTIDDVERTWFPRYHYDIAESTSFRRERFSVLAAVTLQQLRFAYALWAAGVALACISFIIEKYSKPFCVKIDCSFLRIGHYDYGYD